LNSLQLDIMQTLGHLGLSFSGEADEFQNHRKILADLGERAFGEPHCLWCVEGLLDVTFLLVPHSGVSPRKKGPTGSDT